jgi:VWFA-related protein
MLDRPRTATDNFDIDVGGTMRYLAPLLIVCACLGADLAPAQTTHAEPEEERPDSGLIEETRRSLIQLDVSVTGPPELTADLKPDDFRLVVGGRVIEEFHADRVCAGQPRPRTLATPQELESPETKGPPVVGVRYLFYFDQNHLTFEGRRQSLEVARKLIPELIFEPNRATIVSSGRSVEILADWTSDQQVLLDALDVLDEDPTQWDTWAGQENDRVLQLAELASVEMDQAGAVASTTGLQQAARSRAMGGSGFSSSDQRVKGAGSLAASNRSSTRHLAPSAKNTARMYRREEKWHTERALTRFSMVLAGMVEMPPPKAVVYFADRMRSNAGDHYMYLFRNDIDGRADPSVALSNSRVIAFEDVLNEAATNGVRLYTVQAEGIPAYLPMPMGGGDIKAFNLTPEATTRRFDEARASLAAFALESGGRAFLNGAKPSAIIEGLQADLGCFYILSFDPEKLREDSALPVLLSSNRKDVKVSTRGRLVIQSESAQLQSRLTAAFVNPTLARSGPPLGATVIPLSFRKGSYGALVQVAVPGSSNPDATWDIGLSLVSGTRVPLKESKRLAMTTPGVPLILELLLEFDPGPYELVVVAHEDGSEKISTGHVEGDWPDPGSPNAAIGPIALLQPGTGAFVQGDDVRREGSLATGEMARTDLPAALVGIVCRPNADALRVERMLVGATSAVFPSLELESGGDRCSVFSDTIPSGTMTSGKFRYEVRVLSRNEEIAGRTHEFMAAALADFEEQAVDSR